MRKPPFRLFSSLSVPALALAASAQAQRPTNAPPLTSRAGAAFTLYLDFNGFNFTGDWGGNDPSGTVDPYTAYRGATSDFTTAQRNEIREIWARTAEKFTAFGINVTTVDPAVAAGQAATDKQRQAFYDSRAGVHHSIVTAVAPAAPGSTSSGVSFLGTTQYAYGAAANAGASRGYHTNFVFVPSNSDFFASTAETIAHEDGHGLRLGHASDYDGSTLVNEYSFNNGASGVGSFAPIMGFSEFAQRGTWRTGPTSEFNGGIENQVASIYDNIGIGGVYEDGIGNSFASATALALSGTSVDSSRAKGVVVPTSTEATALGESSYQGGYFSFRSSGGAISLTAHNGSSFLQPGVADLGMTLRNTLRIFDANRNLVGTGAEDANTLFTRFNGTLAPGSYYAFVTSTGGWTSASDPRSQYYNMGSYFLSGTGFAAVPEPATMVALALGCGAFLRRRARSPKA